MNQDKANRIEKARKEAFDREQKALTSLAFCLSRADVMRNHHDALIYEIMEENTEFDDVRKARFAAYICFWFASLAAVIERYQELSRKGTIPKSKELSELLTDKFIDLLKPFRNAVAHCSDHDDKRVLTFLEHPRTIPDHAEKISLEFRSYFKNHRKNNA